MYRALPTAAWARRRRSEYCSRRGTPSHTPRISGARVEIDRHSLTRCAIATSSTPSLGHDVQRRDGRARRETVQVSASSPRSAFNYALDAHRACAHGSRISPAKRIRSPFGGPMRADLDPSRRPRQRPSARFGGRRKNLQRVLAPPAGVAGECLVALPDRHRDHVGCNAR